MKNKIHPYYYLGGLIGLVLGYIVAKLYQIWVIVDLERDVRFGVLPMFWEIATTKPALFTFWVVLVYIIIGIVFVKILLSASKMKIE